jgi:hypothetical protein
MKRLKKNWFSLSLASVVVLTIVATAWAGIDTWNQNKKRIVTAVETSNMPLAYTLTLTKASKPVWVGVHLNAAATQSENLVLSIDSIYGSTYDLNLRTTDMAGVQDVLYDLSSLNNYLEVGDKVLVTYANSDSRTYGLILKYEID